MSLLKSAFVKDAESKHIILFLFIRAKIVNWYWIYLNWQSRQICPSLPSFLNQNDHDLVPKECEQWVNLSEVNARMGLSRPNCQIPSNLCKNCKKLIPQLQLPLEAKVTENSLLANAITLLKVKLFCEKNGMTFLIPYPFLWLT